MTDPFAPRRDASEPEAAPTLSPQGRARRDAMLVDLQSAVVSAARRRLAVRTAAVAAPAAIALLAAAAVLNPAPASRPVAERPAPAAPAHLPGETAPVAVVASTAAAPAPYTMKHANFQVIQRPSRVHIVSGPPLYVETISDEELLDTLRATGQDVGLIRTGRRVILTDNTPAGEDDSSSRAEPREPARADPAV